MQGAAGDQTNVLRHDCALEVLGEHPEIEVVADLPADWATEKALAVTGDILTANPEVDALFVINDSMAYGSLQALQEAGGVWAM